MIDSIARAKLQNCLALLPQDDLEREQATIPQIVTPARERLYAARAIIDGLLRSPAAAEVVDIAELVPWDALHLEAIITAAEGQSVIRTNLSLARDQLEALVRRK